MSQPPRISKRSISSIQKVITGDAIDANKKSIAPYLSGPKLVAFFNDLGVNDDYPSKGGFPSRWLYVENNLESMNGSQKLVAAIEAAVNPVRFLDSPFTAEAAVAHVNKYLAFDGLTLVPAGKGFRLQTAGDQRVVSETVLQGLSPTSHEFIAEQVAKCDRKLNEADYDGAITNARSLLEAVLFEIEGQIDPAHETYDGDLPRLFRRVQKQLNLEPDRTDINQSLKQLLSGLSNIVHGLAPLRNKMGDAHVRSFKPLRHHAKLAVNAAKTLADFLSDSYHHQSAKGLLQRKL